MGWRPCLDKKQKQALEKIKDVLHPSHGWEPDNARIKPSPLTFTKEGSRDFKNKTKDASPKVEKLVRLATLRESPSLARTPEPHNGVRLDLDIKPMRKKHANLERTPQPRTPRYGKKEVALIPLRKPWNPRSDDELNLRKANEDRWRKMSRALRGGT